MHNNKCTATGGLPQAIEASADVWERVPLGAAARGGSPERSGPSDMSPPPTPLPALVAAPNITATSAGASGRTRGGGAPASPPELNRGGAGPWLTADATAEPLPPAHGTAPEAPWSPHGGGPGVPPCLGCLHALLLLDVLCGGGGSASAAGAGAAASVLGLGLASGGGAGGGVSTSASSAHTGSAVPSVDETVMKRAGMRREQLMGWSSCATVSSSDAQIGLPPAYTDSSAAVGAARTSIRAPARSRARCSHATSDPASCGCG